MSFLWYWPAGGYNFDAWKKSHDWSPITSDQSGHKDPIPLITPGMTPAACGLALSNYKKISTEILGTLSDAPPITPHHEPLGRKYDTGKFSMQRYRYALTDEEWGYAWLLVPHKIATSDNAAVLALHQTSCSGKNEVVGLDIAPADNPDDTAGVTYAAELAERGFVTLAPDAIAFGERQSGHRNAKYHSADEFFTAQPHASVMGKMAFDTSRALDFLQQCPETKIQKFACIGHSHGGYGTLFAMLADTRISAGVISCGLNCLRDDPSPHRWWELTALMPRLGFYASDITQTPIDFHIWIASTRPPAPDDLRRPATTRSSPTAPHSPNASNSPRNLYPPKRRRKPATKTQPRPASLQRKRPRSGVCDAVETPDQLGTLSFKIPLAMCANNSPLTFSWLAATRSGARSRSRKPQLVH